MEPFIGSMLFLEVGSGVRVGVMCMGECARSKIKLKAQASPNPVPTATGPWDGRLCAQGRPGLPAPLNRDFK